MAQVSIKAPPPPPSRGVLRSREVPVHMLLAEVQDVSHALVALGEHQRADPKGHLLLTDWRLRSITPAFGAMVPMRLEGIPKESRRATPRDAER